MKALAYAVALGLAVAVAPAAQADNDQYDQYMISHGEVSGAGANCSVQPCGNSLEYLLQQGKNACAAFAQGVSDTSITGQLEGAPGPYSQTLSRATAGNVVYAAHHYLCS
jgi:hypothetical protein